MPAIYIATAKTPDPATYRGQKAEVLTALKSLGGKADLAQIAKKCLESGRYVFRNRAWVETNAGGLLGSVRYHLQELVSQDLLLQEGDEAITQSTLGERIASMEKPPAARRNPKAIDLGPIMDGRMRAAEAEPSITVFGPMELLKEWADWQPANHPPFVLSADKEKLESERSSKAVVNIASWSEAIAAEDFGQPDDKRLHLGLLPQPFIGDLQRASIYVLSLNPGLGPTDYYGEYEVPEYKNALLATLKQQFDKSDSPFIFLDPRYSWHGGFRYWHGKLSEVIKTFADDSKQSFAKARAMLASELASIELLPYHSAKFSDADNRLCNLRSVALARAFVKDFVVPRVERGEAIAVALRKAHLWGLPAIPGVIQYEKKQAQGASLTTNSPGGRAILECLRKLHRSRTAERSDRSVGENVRNAPTL